MNIAWKFREMSRGEINVDPIEGEFFATEALGSLSDALVRESIQNSLDAKAGTGPIKVRFSSRAIYVCKFLTDSVSVILLPPNRIT